MKNTNELNYLMVNNNLLANTKLSSTQKLFISFILGWQRSDLTCKMTNRNLASHFGMKRGGIRSLLNKLNKYNFFETTQYGHTNKNSIWTSGHEMKVDEVKLMDFLKTDKIEHEFTPASQTALNEAIGIAEGFGETTCVTEEVLEEQVENENEDEVQNEINKTIDDYEAVTQYRDDELVDIEKILTNLNFNQSDTTHFIQRFRSNKVIFEDFASYFFGLILAQEREEHYWGVKISKEQEEKFKTMLID